MSEFFVDEMSGILDAERKVSHKKLSDEIDKKIDGKFFPDHKAKLPNDFNAENLDWAYGPVIQSGGKYDLKLTAQSNDANLSPDTIIAGLGLRYRSYCAMLARTYLVDPSKAQQNNYKLLSQVHEAIIKEAKEGVAAKDLYNKALGIIKSKKPDLEKYFLKNVGGGIGIETRDNTLTLNAKNTRVLKDGMTLNITTGFGDIPNPDTRDKNAKTYSLLISDTIRIRNDDKTVNFTSSTASEIDNIEFFFQQDEDAAESPEKTKSKKDSKIGAVATSNITKSRLRAERTTQVDEGAEQRRRMHQKELANKRQQAGLEKYKASTNGQNGVAEKKFKRFESYKRENQIPASVKELGIVVDERASTVILPIMGRPVPFHIHTIKTVSANDEGGNITTLRINFLSPGQGVGRKDDQPFEDPQAHFVRSLTYRSKDSSDRIKKVVDRITELRKSLVKREQEKKIMEDVVEQEKLSEIRSMSCIPFKTQMLTCSRSQA